MSTESTQITSGKIFKMDKKEMKKQFKSAEIPMGIYRITNLVNNKIFIGSSLNLPGRISRHKFELKFGSDQIKELQEDYNKFGEEKLVFEIIDTLKPKDEPGYNPKEDITTLEELWIEKLQPFGDKGYNTHK